ncbi:MAG: hypothetical protein ACAH80_14905 [Alphaproteobacteria bacterium]
MGDKHLTIENADGTSPTSRWTTTETYKVSDTVAAQFAAMKQQLTGRDAKDWVRDHGGVLDDGNGHAARISTKKKNGAQLIDHYEDGKMTTTDYVKPKGKDGKDHDHAGAELLLLVLTGGASLFIPHDLHAGEEKAADSKFGTTRTQTATADSAEGPAATAASREPKATTASTGPATRPKR